MNGLVRLVNIQIVIKLDTKNIFIIVLGVSLVLSFIFRPSKDIDMYEDEISNLRMLNEGLVLSNDTLSKLNKTLSLEIKDLLNNVDSTQSVLNDTEDKLKDLENGKGKVSGYVSTLNAYDVANKLTNYLNGG